MNNDFDIAVVGSGFGGSLIAMIARKLGRSVILLERGQHPRFAIGESSTPLANLLLEEVALRFDLPRLRPLSKWGTWQPAYPDLACGLKRGFTFYHHQFGKPFGPDPGRQRQLLVAASPEDRIADTHWYRPDFDHFLVREAQATGVEYLDQTRLHNLSVSEGEVRVEVERLGTSRALRTRFLIDATGPRGFIHRALGLPEIPMEHLPNTQGLFTHFSGVQRLGDLGLVRGDEEPPYPVDDAALHHVFEGGWIWVLRFNNGITSAGVAATDALANELRFVDGEPAWHRLLQRLPTVQEQFREARALLPFIHSPRLAFRSGVVSGPRWALLPSAAGFVDPLLSTGFALTLSGILRLGKAIEEDWQTERFAQRLGNYAERTTQELLAAERMVASLYASMNDFPMFTGLSLLYFAAVSFSETARRLGRPELASSFLLYDHPLFGPAARECCERILSAPGAKGLSQGERAAILAKVNETIRPFDVAGLGDRSRRNWYPAKAADLIAAAPKFGVTTDEVRSLLVRCGFRIN
jgi:FADH2 O2-dependent halogenase